MRNIFKATGFFFPALAILATVSSCTQEPVLSIDSTKEEYTKNFIMEFGVPAEGHDFAMATSAGLKIKTASDAHVTVTAEIDGKEYLFADLNVPEGTHPIPVTIPRSVTTLKVKSGFSTYEAGVNDIVDIDADTPASRTVSISGPDDNGKLTLTDNKDETPVISFSPDEFLNDYLNKFQKTTDSTDKWYVGKYVDKGYINPSLDNQLYAYYGETGLGATDPMNKQNGLQYFIFPIWWNTNRYGDKDYWLTLVQYDKANNMISLPFNDSENEDIPFPQLGYSESVVSHENAVTTFDSFTFDNGEFTQAYDPTLAKTVVSKGVKVDMKPDPNDRSAFRLDLRCAFGKETYSYSSSVPYYNAKSWGDKYYDETISDLMFSTVSTMMYPLDERSFKISNLKTGNDDADKGEYYVKYPFLLGFSSQPSCAADKTPRNYMDLILLVLPITNLKIFYNIDEIPEPFIWTMAVEDLGGTDDWDFNDVVFHFTDVITNLNSANGNKIVTYYSGPKAAANVRTIKVWPVATGGTMPIYITFSGTVANVSSVALPEWGDEMFSTANDKIINTLKSTTTGTFVVGKEVHDWLGASSYKEFVNVGNNRSGIKGQPVEFIIPYDHLPVYEVDKYDYVFGSENNKTLYGFSMLVDKDNTLGMDALTNGKGIERVPQNIKFGEGTYMIGAPNEKGSVAPQMLLISDNGEWEWPTERTKISDAYKYFSKWIGNPNYDVWFYYPNESLVTKK